MTDQDDIDRRLEAKRIHPALDYTRIEKLCGFEAGPQPPWEAQEEQDGFKQDWEEAAGPPQCYKRKFEEIVGEDCTNKRRSSLFLASRLEGNAEEVSYLIDVERANLGQWDANRSTPLFEASRLGNTAVADVLLTHAKTCLACTVDVNQPVRGGFVPIWAACVGGHVSTATLLLENGADPSLPDSTKGYTPLMAAVYSGRRSMVYAVLAQLRKDTVRETKHREGDRRANYYDKINFVSNNNLTALNCAVLCYRVAGTDALKVRRREVFNMIWAAGGKLAASQQLAPTPEEVDENRATEMWTDSFLFKGFST
jgi:hypothetical protein